MGTIWADFQNFLKRPFSPDMSAYGWFLFFGLILIIAWFWHMIQRALINI